MISEVNRTEQNPKNFGAARNTDGFIQERIDFKFPAKIIFRHYLKNHQLHNDIFCDLFNFFGTERILKKHRHLIDIISRNFKESIKF